MKPTEPGNYRMTAPSGQEITGIIQKCVVVYSISDIVGVEEDNTLRVEYAGQADYIGDKYDNLGKGGGMLFQDEDGNEWEESELVYTLIVDKE